MSDLLGPLQRALGDEYALERETTRTAIARVFIARERVFNRAIAVLVLAPDAAGDLDFERFTVAAGRASAFDHPGIVPPLAFGTVLGLPYVITPYVPGVTLRARLAEQPPQSLEEIVGVLRDVAIALDYAHTRGAVHLHLTPDEVLLSQQTTRLLDFGLEAALAYAQRVKPPEKPRLTGSPHCLAPEQLGDTADSAGHLADIFAWGCLAYEMLTGMSAFHRTALTPGAPIPLDPDPAPITLTRRDVPSVLVRVIMRCLSADPANRPSSAANLVQLLSTVDVSEKALAERMLTPAYVPKVTREVTRPVTRQATAQQPVQVASSARWWQDRRKVAGVAAGVLAVLGVAGWSMRREPKPEAPIPVVRPAVVPGSVVVLPMVATRGDSATTEVGVGFADEIAAALARTGTRTLGRLSGGTLRQRGLDPRTVAQELGAAAALTGTLYLSGDSVQVDVTLTSWDRSAVSWSGRYARSTADLFAISSDIATNVAGALRGRPVTGGAAARIETADPQAHLALLRGAGALTSLRSASMSRAAAHFAQAIARDSLYARAHGLLALVHALPAAVEASSESRRQELVLASASRAIALDSTLAEPWQARAFVQLGRAENREAARLFERAIALDSTQALAWTGFGLLANHIGDYALARSRLAQARRYDAGLRVVDAWTAQVAFGEGKRDRAEAESRLRHRSDSAFTATLATRVEALVATNRAPEAVTLLEAAGVAQMPVTSEARALLAFASASAGDADKAREILLAMRDASAGSLPADATLAATLAALGDVDSAMGVLQRAAARRDPMLVLYGRSERFSTLRKDARGAEVFARLERW